MLSSPADLFTDVIWAEAEVDTDACAALGASVLEGAPGPSPLSSEQEQVGHPHNLVKHTNHRAVAKAICMQKPNDTFRRQWQWMERTTDVITDDKSA